jgi:hypothetical protein
MVTAPRRSLEQVHRGVRIRSAWKKCGVTASLPVGREPRRCRECEGLAEWDQISSDRGEFAGRRTVGIGRYGRRATAVEATFEHGGGFEFAQAAAIQEQSVWVVRNFAAGRETRDRYAVECDESQRVLGAVGKESVPVPNGDETDGAVPFLKGCDPTKHL